MAEFLEFIKNYWNIIAIVIGTPAMIVALLNLRERLSIVSIRAELNPEHFELGSDFESNENENPKNTANKIFTGCKYKIVIKNNTATPIVIEEPPKAQIIIRYNFAKLFKGIECDVTDRLKKVDEVSFPLTIKGRKEQVMLIYSIPADLLKNINQIDNKDILFIKIRFKFRNETNNKIYSSSKIIDKCLFLRKGTLSLDFDRMNEIWKYDQK